MSPVVGFWSSGRDVYHFALTDPQTSPAAIIDDFISVVLFTAFSVIQARISFQIVYHLIQRRSGRSSRKLGIPPATRSVDLFAVVGVCLFCLYVLSAIFFLANFGLKLSGAAKIVKLFSPPLNEWGLEGREWDGDRLVSVAGTCAEKAAQGGSACARWIEYPYTKVSTKLDIVTGSLLQAVIFTADGLLLYRCFLIFQGQWLIYVMGGLVYLASIVLFIVYTTIAYASRLDEAYVVYYFIRQEHIVVLEVGSSLLVNLLVTISISIRLLRARRNFKGISELYDDHDSSSSFYRTVVSVLLEAALPPAVFGVIACAVTIPLRRVGFAGDVTHFVRVLWVSFTALAPQLIAVRVLEGRSSEQKQSCEDEFSRPLSFAKPVSTLASSPRKPEGITDTEMDIDSLTLSPHSTMLGEEEDVRSTRRRTV